MIILGLDTANTHCTAALIKDGVTLISKSENIGRGHAERLAPMVQDIIKIADLEPQDINRLGVCTGPGSFTGLRVALAFAKGFALPRALPIIGLSALECLAAQTDPHKSRRVAAIMNVRRGQVCWAAYDKGQAMTAPITQNIEAARNTIAALDCEHYAGDGAALLGLTGSFETCVDGAVLAAISAGRTANDSPATPLYARGPDAKLPGGITP